MCGIEIKCCTDKRDKVLIMIKWVWLNDKMGVAYLLHEIPML